MEYSVYITYNCNLRCPFCYVKGKLSDKKQRISDSNINQIVKYIALHNKKNDWVVFFGGEPLLAPKAVEKIIFGLQETGIRFAIYTNGLLLEKFPQHILRKIDVVLISADGDKKTQEKYRGKGSHQKLLRNIDAIKSSTDAFIIGRMTVSEETNLYRSATNLLDHTDGIHWQIANMPDFKNSSEFIKRYKAGLEKLFNYWLVSLNKGKNLNVIPFQAVVSTLVFGYPKHKNSFRCGVGKSVQVIDIDGKIYWCDELVGNKEALLGKITDKLIRNNYKTHLDLFQDCKNCGVSKICRGRCRKCLEVYTTEHNQTYCKLTKFLIDMIKKKEKEIKRIIKRQNLTLDRFYKIRYLTEEIP